MHEVMRGWPRVLVWWQRGIWEHLGSQVAAVFNESSQKGSDELGLEHFYMKSIGKAANIAISVPICRELTCAKKYASYTLSYLITHPVPLEKVGVVSPTFNLWDMKIGEVMELMQCHTAS